MRRWIGWYAVMQSSGAKLHRPTLAIDYPPRAVAGFALW
jgi:hypothetical protein